MKKNARLLCLLLALALLLSGCGKAVYMEEPLPAAEEPAETAAGEADPAEGAEESPAPSAPEETPPPSPAPAEPYVFNPHLYSPMLSAFYPQEWWDSFYNLCDALREGRSSFACVSQEAYDWCMDEVTLADLFPAACVVVKGESDDGSAPYEDGVGKIHYRIPPEDYVVRQADFEALIEEILNRVLEPDDTDFEKCLKLYAYMASEYTYGDIFNENEGYTYTTLVHKEGVCENLSGVYVYLLLQVGVDALNVGCFEGIQHAWTYLILDGEGYYTDPTWALHEEGEALSLTYFLNSEETRNAFGLPTDDLTAGMVPGFWLSRTDTKLPATSEAYGCLLWSEFVSLDEEEKILYYDDGAGVHGLPYA